MRNSRGFTLVELMLAVFIIAVLSAIAIPQYNEYILKGKLAEAATVLSTAQLRMEQYYQDNRAYGPTGGVTCGIAPGSLSTTRFTLTCVTQKVDGSACDVARQCYTYSATSVGLGNPEFVFNVTETGAKSTTQVPSGWATNATCWLRGKGAC
jgi:type IV pilus assembly protein PilE